MNSRSFSAYIAAFADKTNEQMQAVLSESIQDVMDTDPDRGAGQCALVARLRA